jgi:hypothetical protein
VSAAHIAAGATGATTGRAAAHTAAGGTGRASAGPGTRLSKSRARTHKTKNPRTEARIIRGDMLFPLYTYGHLFPNLEDDHAKFAAGELALAK